MIQFFRFNDSQIEESQYSIFSFKEALKFFGKQTFFLFLFIYSTFFLAVALPFVETPCQPVYFIGGMISVVFLARYLNGIIKYYKFKDKIFKLSKVKLSIGLEDKEEIVFKADDISYLELNFFNDLVIKDKNRNRAVFPLMLMSKEQAKKILNNFQDMAPKRTAFYKKIWDFADSLVVALIIAVHIIQYLIQAYYIPTGSMEDTLLVGDHLFVEKITYGPIIPKMLNMEKPVHLSFLSLRNLQRGDIVIFRPPHERDKDYIKRCIALPGDKVEIKGGKVYIDNKPLNEPYVKGKTYDEFGRSQIQGIVPKGKIVVLGDNRENSSDGRFFGYLNIEEIKGKAFFLYWNTDQIKKMDFSRFGLIK